MRRGMACGFVVRMDTAARASKARRLDDERLPPCNLRLSPKPRIRTNAGIPVRGRGPFVVAYMHVHRGTAGEGVVSFPYRRGGAPVRRRLSTGTRVRSDTEAGYRRTADMPRSIAGRHAADTGGG